MQHQNFFTFSASTNFDLGLQLGETFRERTQESIAKGKENKDWEEKRTRSLDYLQKSEPVFPQLVEEIKGYANGAGVDFIDLWTRSLEDEFDHYQQEKCTAVFTNNGLLVSHNEDWASNSQDNICVVKKSINGLTIFELFYFNTLGGNSISINSHGYVQSINTLSHSDWQIGIPRNVIARWLSETSDPEKDFEKLKSLKRSMGYNHVLVNLKGEIYNIECTSKQQELTKPLSPFVHTNHYTGTLKDTENKDIHETNSSTFNRYRKASSLVRSEITIDELMILSSNQDEGPNQSILNERTIGKMIIDLENKVAKVWLLRENEAGWIDYDLDFI